MDTRTSKTILLVEDEILIAMAETKQLEKEGYRIIHSLSGEKAIDLVCVKGTHVDLILMDINLGEGLDGTETAQEILKYREIPILFLSSHIEKDIVEKTESITNYGYVVKNSSITVLDASIKMAFKLFDAYISIQSQRMDMESANEEMRVINDHLVQSENQLIKSEASVRNKLKAILEPEGDITSLELSDIIDSQNIQSLMEDFHQLTGILGAILDIKGNILVAAGWQDICTKFHRCNPVTAKYCKESDTMLTNGVEEGTFKLYKCKNNMWDMVTPLVINNYHVGNIFIGQFIFDDEEPDIELFRTQARRYGFDEDEYLATLARVPRFSRKTANTGMAFYSKVAKMISELSYSSIKLSRTLNEWKNAEGKIRNLLNEKELILKEVHHRIKNNLGVINALLSMQSDNQENPDVRNILLDAASRVESMRVLYDKLYTSGNFQKANLRDYLSLLIREVLNIFPKKCPINLIVDIEDAILDAKLISVIGIIVNELVTNSIKYAFTGRAEGTIKLESFNTGSGVDIIYKDDGVGIPESVDFGNSTGFGMQLIRMLVEEVAGTIRIDREGGTKFSLSFTT